MAIKILISDRFIKSRDFYKASAKFREFILVRSNSIVVL
jgi:hypothetical protein